jgi:sensor histidine kinase regulating citrate/malate metabolism
VQLVVAPPIDARVRARLWDIVSTLVNVVTNAVEAIEGEGTIRISTHESHDGRRAYIQVENTGRVFTQDEADKFSEWGFTTKRGEHRGYGLQLAKEHVSALEGDVRVVAPPEGGIKVIVSLPIADTRTLEVTKS